MNEENKNLSNNPINGASMPKGVDDKENSFAPPEAVNSEVDIKKLTEEIEKNPKNPYCYYDRAKGYYSLNMFEKALEDIDKTIELHVDELQIFVDKGIILKELSRYNEAIECFSKAIELEPKIAILYNRRGVCFFQIKDYVSAIKDFKMVIKLGSQYPIDFFNLADSLKCNKEYEEALYYVNKALEISPKNVDGYICKADIYNLTHFYKEAIDSCTKAIELDDKDFYAYRQRAKLYYFIGDDEKAIADSKKIIELVPNYCYAYGDYICYCENFAKRYKDAIMCCKEAFKLDISADAKKEIQDKIKLLKNKLRDERWYNRLHRWLKSKSWYPFAFITVYSFVFSIVWTVIYQHVFGYKFDICYILTSKFFVVVSCIMFYTMLYQLIKIRKKLNWVIDEIYKN